MTDTPTDLDGNPYTTIFSATCALHMACEPSQIEFRLDARAKMDAIIIERWEREDPYVYESSRY